MERADADPGRLLELIGAGWTTQVVRAACELGVVDALAGSVRPVDELAAALEVDQDALARLVRALVVLGLCTVDAGGAVALTPTGTLLAPGPGSLAPWAQWWGGPVWAEWGALPDAIRTGRPVRRGDGFAGHADDPARATLFDAAMAGLSALEVPSIVAALALRGDELVVDLGGGAGALLRAVLEHHPEATGRLVDLPHAVAAARSLMAEAGLADRCDAVEGDLRSPAPAGGDVYVLKNVLHDWDDAAARRILEACAAGAATGARVLVVERLVPEVVDGAAAGPTVRMDLHMLVAQGGRERTEAELRALLDAVGLRVVAVRPAGGALAVIDAIVDRDGGVRSEDPDGQLGG